MSEYRRCSYGVELRGTTPSALIRKAIKEFLQRQGEGAPVKMPGWSKQPVRVMLIVAGLVYTFGPVGLAIYFGARLAQHVHIEDLLKGLFEITLMRVGSALRALFALTVATPVILAWFFVVLGGGLTKRLSRWIGNWYYDQYGEKLGLLE